MDGLVIKHFPGRYKDLGSDPWNVHKNLGPVQYLCNTSTWETDQQLVSSRLQSQSPKSNPVENTRGRQAPDVNLCLHP